MQKANGRYKAPPPSEHDIALLTLGAPRSKRCGMGSGRRFNLFAALHAKGPATLPMWQVLGAAARIASRGTSEGVEDFLSPLLQITDLHTEFRTGAGVVRAVDGISYIVERGETVAIVGESGSGKSVGALSILRLIPDPPGRITRGEILFAGRDLMRLSDAQMREVRGAVSLP
jgi:ABC-type multidrug transport system fused ATPase/permease subunit